MTKHNPEEMLLASISSCHMLWYLHLCSSENISVTSYIDNANGVMLEYKNGSGKFTEVILNPIVTISDIAKKEIAETLHAKANEMCFIANSLNFIVKHNPIICCI
jgi:organic hydroperoxide reductase OsmC/OhrA